MLRRPVTSLDIAGRRDGCGVGNQQRELGCGALRIHGDVAVKRLIRPCIGTRFNRDDPVTGAIRDEEGRASIPLQRIALVDEGVLAPKLHKRAIQVAGQ